MSQPISNKEITIVPYSDEYKLDFKRLNYEWLEKYFSIEPNDELVLSDPKKYIIDKGGFIYFATLSSTVVGTASIVRMNNGQYELSKMAVTPSAQGHGIGRKLITHVIQEAKKYKIPELVLFSNTQLKPAIQLYRNFGFKEVPIDCSSYKRTNIKMLLNL